MGDHAAGQKIIQGSGPEQIFVKGNLLFASMLHSDKVEVFRINQNPPDPSQILTELGTEYTGGITPQGIAVSPDGKTVYTANMQTEDVSYLSVGAGGKLTRMGNTFVGVTDKTPDPTSGGNGAGLFATDEEIGLRWFFTNSYSDDGQKSCGFCHWQSRHDGGQWNVGANALGGVKATPQNKEISDNWPEWFEGLNNNTASGERKWVNVSVIVARIRNERLMVHLARDVDARHRLETLTKDIAVHVGRLTGLEVEQILQPARSRPPKVPLTSQEVRILHLLSLARSTAAIGRELQVSTVTVRNHVQNILRKMNAQTRLEAVMRAAREGMI